MSTYDLWLNNSNPNDLPEPSDEALEQAARELGDARDEDLIARAFEIMRATYLQSLQDEAEGK